MRGQKIIFLGKFAGLVVIFCNLLCISTVYGQHWQVSPGQSIQAVIDQAENGDIIELALGQYQEMLNFRGKTIHLTSSEPDNEAVVAGTVLNCAGLGNSGILLISGESRDTIIEGLTITGGTGYYGWAGAIVIANKSGATIRNCIISNHHTTTSAGAITCEGSSGVDFINCKFINNRSVRYGGAIYATASTINFIDCEFINNSISLLNGGALYLANNCRVNIQRSYFSGNNAKEQGGTIFASNSTLTIKDSYILAGQANYGGGIYGFGNNGRIDNSVFNGNIALQGGALFYASNSKPTIYNSVLAGNKASNSISGGALHSVTNSNVKVRNSIFWKNQSLSIAQPTGSTDIKYCYVSGGWGVPDPQDGGQSPWDHNLNPVDDNPGFNQAGSWQDGQWVEIEDARIGYRTIQGSICYDAGEPDYCPAYELKDIDGNSRFCNVAVDIGINELQPGHRVYNQNSLLWFGSIQAAVNQAATGDIITVNPGLYQENIILGDITLQSRQSEKMEFRENTVITAAQAGPTVTISDGGQNETLLLGLTIAGGDNSGSGVYITKDNVIIKRCIISNHQAENGAGLWASDCDNIKIEQTIIKDNIAELSGGAIKLDNVALLKLNDSVIAGNESQDVAGGIYCGLTSNIIIERCTIKDNFPYAMEYMGVNQQKISNSIIWNNKLASDEMQNLRQFMTLSDDYLLLSFCNIQGGWDDADSFKTDPMFLRYTDATGNNKEHYYKLQNTSPCINAGDLAFQDEDAVDLENNKRVAHCSIDIGAWENPEPSLTRMKKVAHNLNKSKWYCTIQESIDQASDGHTIEIGVGIYKENIIINKPFLTLRGASAWERDIISQTIIDGQQQGPVIMLEAEKANGTNIRALTIKNGLGENGGGISSENNGNITITNCNILHNVANENGGGIYLEKAPGSKITFCLIGENTAPNGAGIYANEANNIDINNNFVIGNIANAEYDSRGGGFYLDNSENININFCTICDNSSNGSMMGSGIYLGNNTSNVKISNSILWGNSPSEIFNVAENQPLVNYCNVQGGWNKNGLGNINVEPGFVNADGVGGEWDWHLRKDSPCVNAGDPAIVYSPTQTDYDGNARCLFGRVDIGADEVTGIEEDLLFNVVRNKTKNTWHNNIQKAIDSATASDTLTVMPGVYRENIVINRNGLILQSREPGNVDVQNMTVISGTGNSNNNEFRSTITMPNSLGRNVKIDGFTIIAGEGFIANLSTPDPNDNQSFGGAIYSVNNNGLTISNCNFLSTAKVDVGGAIFIDGSQNQLSTIENCWFGFFDAGLRGGAISLDRCYDFVIKNCVIANCDAADNPGSIDMQRSRRVNIKNCTVYASGPIRAWDNCVNLSIKNSIIWAGQNGAIDDIGKFINVSYSNIQAGYAGLGNIDTDPLFGSTNINDYDFHLQSTIGRWCWKARSWVKDQLDSPCLAMGDPQDDQWKKQCWPNGGRINMGAYGGTPEASLSNESDNMNIADINMDNVVDIKDLAGLLQNWLSYGRPNIYDRNNDGRVDLYDFQIISNNWLWPAQ